MYYVHHFIGNKHFYLVLSNKKCEFKFKEKHSLSSVVIFTHLDKALKSLSEKPYLTLLEAKTRGSDVQYVFRGDL